MTEGKILVAEDNGTYLLKLTGDVRMTLCTSLNSYMEAIFQNTSVKSVLVDLLNAEGVDSTTLGLLAKLAIHCEKQYGIVPTVFCTDESLLRILLSMGLDDVFEILQDCPETLKNLHELDSVNADVEQIRGHVLEAHKLLSLLNSQNQKEFVDLIRALENP